MKYQSSVEIAAQFGGSDAAEYVLAHYKALKTAASRVTLEAFPFANLTFILRVDGEVSSFGGSGPKDVKIGRDREFVSVDLGVTIADRVSLATAESVLLRRIRETPNLFRSLKKFDNFEIDYAALGAGLELLVEEYNAEMRKRLDRPDVDSEK